MGGPWSPSVREIPLHPRLIPPLSSLSPLLPDLSDLESAFLHLTFLPVRRQIDTRRQDVRVWMKASRETVDAQPSQGSPLGGALKPRKGSHLLIMMRMPSRNNMVARVMPTVCTVS